MKKYIHAIDNLNDWIGKIVAWLTTFMVLIVCVDVGIRYLLGGKIEMGALLSELEWHIFSIVFLFGAAFTLRHDKHVRVDLFYARWGKKTPALVNLLGCIFLLIPFSWIVIEASIPYILDSWAVKESSSDAGGLPARYLIKACIPIGMVLLILQATAFMGKSWVVLTEK